MASGELLVGECRIVPKVADGFLVTIGEISVRGTPLRNPSARFLPWFDTPEGDVFRSFRFLGTEARGDETVILLRAVSDPDYPFMETRDSSGDVCLRSEGWDAEPKEADFRVVLAPAGAELDGRRFAGFTYRFEFESEATAIHRILDRQTWEVGGGLDDVTVVCRNLYDLPHKKATRDGTYSTVGLENRAGLMPGNLWARWALMPAFDMHYGERGIVVAWFDRVSLVRSVVESMPGEDRIRYVDAHYFELSRRASTNPKTVLFCPDRLDEVDAMNLWTRVHDRERERARRQFGIGEEEPPAAVLSLNLWTGFRFDSSYEHVVDVAAEFGADYVFIDAVWENMQAFRETIEELVPEERRRGTILDRFRHGNMCCTMDFRVAEVFGGEDGLRRLCERAREKGVGVLSWMSLHYTPSAALQREEALGRGGMGVFAAKESSRHPDTGYPADCWPANLNAPVFARIREQILGACRRTGLAGFLWDSFSNLGWWQVDYSDGSMRPQFDRAGELYAELVNSGLYVMPEAIAALSSHSCLGMHGGDLYEGELLGYSYDTSIGLARPPDWKDRTAEILRGNAPIEDLFRCIAHRRVPDFHFHEVPRDEWDEASARTIRELIAVYKRNRHLMKRRTVLKGGRGVLWEGGDEGRRLLFSFREQPRPEGAADALTDEPVEGDAVSANRAYRLPGAAPGP